MLLYADEDFPYPVVDELRQLGHDVLTREKRPAPFDMLTVFAV
jgi:hypothetical protein